MDICRLTRCICRFSLGYVVKRSLLGMTSVSNEPVGAEDAGYAEYSLLLDALGLVPGCQERLLIRGGTSPMGMAAASIASGPRQRLASTTCSLTLVDR